MPQLRIESTIYYVCNRIIYLFGYLTGYTNGHKRLGANVFYPVCDDIVSIYTDDIVLYVSDVKDMMR